MLKWLFCPEEKERLKKKAKEVNELPSIEKDRMIRIALVAFMEKGNITSENIHKVHFGSGVDYKIKVGVFTYDKEEDRYVICDDIQNAKGEIPKNRGVIDLKGNYIGSPNIFISDEVSFNILKGNYPSNIKEIILKGYCDKIFRNIQYVNSELLNPKEKLTDLYIKDIKENLIFKDEEIFMMALSIYLREREIEG